MVSSNSECPNLLHGGTQRLRKAPAKHLGGVPFPDRDIYCSSHLRVSPAEDSIGATAVRITSYKPGVHV